MNKYLILLISICIVSFLSCQKEISSPIPNGNQTNDSSTLYKIVTLDSNFVDTFQVAYLYYDSHNRISRSVGYDYPSNTDSFIVDYKYHGDDTTFSSMISKNNNSTFSDTVFYFYDLNGKVIKDSITSSFTVSPGTTSYITTNQYVQKGASIIKYGKLYNSLYPTVLVSVDTFYEYPIVANGNIVAQKDTGYYHFGDYYFTDDYSITYDNTNSQLFKNFPQYYVWDADGSNFDASVGYFKNNVLSTTNMRNDPYGPRVEETRYVREFNSKGLPIKIDSYYSSSGHEYRNARIFLIYN